MAYNEIPTQARTWLGTRFVHQGRVKKTATSRGGVDCIGLVIGVAEELGIKCKGRSLRELDNVNYSRNPDGESLQRELDRWLVNLKFTVENLKLSNPHPNPTAYATPRRGKHTHWLAVVKRRRLPEEEGALCRIQPGDILLMRIRKDPQHVAFVGDYAGGGLSLIHAYIQARGVVEHRLDAYWLERVVGVYRF